MLLLFNCNYYCIDSFSEWFWFPVLGHIKESRSWSFLLGSIRRPRTDRRCADDVQTKVRELEAFWTAEVLFESAESSDHCASIQATEKRYFLLGPWTCVRFTDRKFWRSQRDRAWRLRWVANHRYSPPPRTLVQNIQPVLGSIHARPGCFCVPYTHTHTPTLILWVPFPPGHWPIHLII